MKITLDGKTYIAPSPKGRMVRRAYEIIENLNPTEVKVADIDILAGFIVKLYGQQFTIDELFDGIDAKQLLPTLGYHVNIVTGRIEEKIEELTSPNG